MHRQFYCRGIWKWIICQGLLYFLILYFNNSTRRYTTYLHIAECRISDLMFVFHGQRKASSAAKLSHICSVISDIKCFNKISQTKPNIFVLDIQLCICFCGIKWDILIPVCSSICPSDRQSFSQCLTQSLPDDILKGLWVSAISFHILTPYF